MAARGAAVGSQREFVMPGDRDHPLAALWPPQAAGAGVISRRSDGWLRRRILATGGGPRRRSVLVVSPIGWAANEARTVLEGAAPAVERTHE